MQGWSIFTDGQLGNYFRDLGLPSQHARLERYARHSEHPTLGDDNKNVRLIKVPWGCGLDLGRCSIALAGRRCPEKELVRETNLVDRLLIDGFSAEEIELSLEEERRIRHLEDVRAVQLGYDPGTPICYDPTRAAKSIQWWWSVTIVNGNVINRQPRSQLWGGASAIGVLAPKPTPKRKQKGGKSRKGKNAERGNPRSRSVITNTCHDDSHRGPPSLFGTLHDTDDETMMVYGQAYPLHIESGIAIIDGSLEYAEAMARSSRSTSSIPCPTIRSRSGRVILEGSPHHVEIVDDGIFEDMARQEQEESARRGVTEAERRGLVHGEMTLVDHDGSGRGIIDYYERSREEGQGR